MAILGVPLANLVLSLAVAGTISLAAYPLARRNSRLTTLGLFGVIAGLVCCPLLIPPQNMGLRAICAFVATDLAFRVIDFARQARRATATLTSAPSASWAQYANFLLPFPVLMIVWGERPPWRFNRAAWQLEPFRVLAGAGLVAAAVWLLILAHRTELLQSSFLLDHIVMVCAYVVAIESLAAFLLGIERVAGFDTEPLIRNAFLARTPAEYWLRYNTRVQRWLQLNVFVPGGGRRHPVRGIVLVFLVSALLHEVMFDIATSEITGYQAAFFLLQIPAVLISRRLEMFAREHGAAGDLVARVVTFVWFAATSVFFFYGVARIFPFIYAGEGNWL